MTELMGIAWKFLTSCFIPAYWRIRIPTSAGLSVRILIQIIYVLKIRLHYKANLKEEGPQNTEQENLHNLEEGENEISAIVPELYSKRVIFAFSMIFSTIFGAVILMSNLKTRSEKKGRIQVLIFSIIYTIGTIISLNSISSTKLTIPLNLLGALILNEYFWNRYLGKDIEFIKKSWIKPAVISLIVCIPFVLAVLYST